MKKLRIDNLEKDLADIDESWINKQINRRREDGLTPCVQVILKENPLDMVLSTAGCSSSGGGGRFPNDYEKRVFDLWEKCGLKKDDFTGGNLIAFLKQLKQ